MNLILNIFYIGWNGCFNGCFLLCRRVNECYPLRMESLTCNLFQGMFQSLSNFWYKTFCFIRPTSIFIISKYWMVHTGRMYTDLMSTSSFGIKSYWTYIIPLIQYLIPCTGLTSSRINLVYSRICSFSLNCSIDYSVGFFPKSPGNTIIFFFNVMNLYESLCILMNLRFYGS